MLTETSNLSILNGRSKSNLSLKDVVEKKKERKEISKKRETLYYQMMNKVNANTLCDDEIKNIFVNK